MIEMTKEKTIVYVDGYNLYYGMLRKSKFKWLDLYALFKDFVLSETAEVIQVRYYTAPVSQKMSDDPASVQRQRIYLQALRKHRAHQVEIIEGKIIVSRPYLRLIEPLAACPEIKRVKVYDFAEKKTDVNIATDLINGAWANHYQQAVLCSNDTDLEPALTSIRKYHPHLKLGLISPVNEDRYISKELSKNATWSKRLSFSHLEKAQLPEKIPHTSIRKPLEW